MTRRNKRKERAHVPVEQIIAPPPEQLARGYTAGYVMDDKGLKAWAHRNPQHDPVTRWENAGKLTPTHVAVIDTVRRLWHITGLHQSVTANYGERIGGTGHAESRALNEIQAREDLVRMEGYIPRPYWQVFENCVRHGWAAGVAGSELGYGDRSAQDRAHMVVVFVCDIIGIKERI